MLNPNPFGPQQDRSGLFSALTARKRLLRNISTAKVDDQIFQIVQEVFEEALKKENILVIDIEKKYMLAQVMKQVLSDMVRRLDASTKL